MNESTLWSFFYVDDSTSFQIDEKSIDVMKTRRFRNIEIAYLHRREKSTQIIQNQYIYLNCFSFCRIMNLFIKFSVSMTWFSWLSSSIDFKKLKKTTSLLLKSTIFAKLFIVDKMKSTSTIIDIMFVVIFESNWLNWYETLIAKLENIMTRSQRKQKCEKLKKKRIKKNWKALWFSDIERKKNFLWLLSFWCISLQKIEIVSLITHHLWELLFFIKSICFLNSLQSFSQQEKMTHWTIFENKLFEHLIWNQIINVVEREMSRLTLIDNIIFLDSRIS